MPSRFVARKGAAATDLVTHWIDARLYNGEPYRLGEVYDPATGDVTRRVALAGPMEVDAAVLAAVRALPEWRATSLTDRTRILFRFRQLLEQRKKDIARVITSEHGKVLSDAEGEVSRGQEVVEFACGIPHLLKGEHSENVSRSVDSYSIRQPVGVVAGITPFNFPAMVPMWMFPLAIACGNTFVLKPSEKDPSTSLLLAELFSEAGLPAGVFNVVNGDKIAVDRLLAHPDVAAVSSVGSTPVARYIYETAGRYGKRVQALGGAKNHMVVLPDADLEIAADAAISAGFGSAGQRCMAISAIIAVGGVGDELLEAIRVRVGRIAVGPGTSEGSEMGPLVTREHRDKVSSYIETGINEGAELAIDGRDVAVPGHEQGFFLGPCLFDRVGPEMTIYKDEIFGPVLSLVRVDSFSDAVTLINQNPYGNGTALFTSSGSAARRFQYEVDVGMVGINIPIPVPMAYYSFGGWRASLFGDSHVHGTEGIHFYTRTKAVISRWPESAHGVDLGFPVS